MFSYIVGLAAVVFIFYNPVSQLWSPDAPAARRLPRPPINEDLLALENAANHTGSRCPRDSYSVHIFSKEPLVLYIENFLSEEERTHLLEISEPIFEPSTITNDGGASTERRSTIRDSEVAMVPRTETVRCIEDRARALQGWRDELWIERLRTQRYRPGGHYNHHFDWSSSRGGWGRISSMMAWVDDGDGELEGGGTEFPDLFGKSNDLRWCRFIDCNDEDEERNAESVETDRGRSGESGYGVTFRPVPGNAVFWENFKPDGTLRSYQETWHAGLPVEKGVKVGLNIWTWGRLD